MIGFSAAKYREALYPYIAGGAAAVAYFLWGNCIIAWAEHHHIDTKAFFGAIFSFSAITSGFLLASFTLAMAPGGGFIERIFRTKTFRLFLRYLAEALILGTILTVVSIPFMVVELKEFGLWLNTALLPWVFSFVAAMLAVFRVASVFLIWIRANSAVRIAQS